MAPRSLRVAADSVGDLDVEQALLRLVRLDLQGRFRRREGDRATGHLAEQAAGEADALGNRVGPFCRDSNSQKPIGRNSMISAPATVGMHVSEVDTPALIIELDALEQNIRRMQGRIAGTGAYLRPHSKTHKSTVIANMQIAAGAVGVCCQKVSEAEIMADGGVRALPIGKKDGVERFLLGQRRDPDGGLGQDAQPAFGA